VRRRVAYNASGSARGTRNRAARLCVPHVSRMANSCAVGMHRPRGTMMNGAILTVLFMSGFVIER
jgi:hypothetical protein